MATTSPFVKLERQRVLVVGRHIGERRFRWGGHVLELAGFAAFAADAPGFPSNAK